MAPRYLVRQPGAVTKVILFDFFGTLVNYEADRTTLAYPRSHRLVARWGWRGDHDGFVTVWDQASQAVDADTGDSHEESTMVDYASAFAQHADLDLTEQQRSELASTFADEWAQHVRPIDGANEMLQDLAGRYRLGIVSNTNDTEMVPRFVADHFTSALFEHIVLSVSHGFRKPHPSIYRVVLDLFAVAPARTVFVGDSYEADYQGPIAIGMDALLIDPAATHPAPPTHRLTSVLDLPEHI